MSDDPKNPANAAQPPDHSRLVDAVYEVALDPTRYNELVDQWHSELTRAQELAPLADHFQRASTILDRVHRDDWQPDPAEATHSQIAMPEVLLGRSGTVLQTNFGATALLSARTGQSLDTLDITPAARETLFDLCQNLATAPAPERREDQSKLLRITRSGDDRPLVVMLSPTTFENKNALALRCAEIVWPESLGPLLARAFDLTTAECEIVQSMVAGHNTATIAETRGTSKETVRTQMRQLLSKTNTHSQLELIRMTIGFSMMSQQAEARAGPASNPRASQSHPDSNTPEADAQANAFAKSTVRTLARGADFELVQYGPDSGSPILVFHDEVIGDGFVPPLLKQAPERRWLVAVRPGYGSTSLQDKKHDAHSQVSDFDEVLTALDSNLRAAPVLAHGNGIYFASEFATTYPARCTSITTLAASLPGNRGENDANRYSSFMAGMGKLAPSMLRFATQAGFAMYARVGAKRFLEQVYGDSKADLSVLNTPTSLAELEHGGRLALAQGYRGFYHDEQTLVPDWSEQFLATPVPVRIVLGDQDQPSRRYRAETLHQASNRVELIESVNSGFFTAFSATELVTETLLRA